MFSVGFCSMKEEFYDWLRHWICLGKAPWVAFDFIAVTWVGRLWGSVGGGCVQSRVKWETTYEKKKNANKNITRKVWGHLHAHITCPPSQRDIRDPESNYLAGCLWLKDGLWPLSQWSDSMLPTVQTSPAANTWEAAIGYETAATRGFLPIVRQFSNVKCLAASAPRLFCLTPYLTWQDQ